MTTVTERLTKDALPKTNVMTTPIAKPDNFVKSQTIVANPKVAKKAMYALLFVFPAANVLTGKTKSSAKPIAIAPKVIFAAKKPNVLPVWIRILRVWRPAI